MYIDYFSMNKPISELFKSVKNEGCISLGNSLNYWDPAFGDTVINCEHRQVEDGYVTLFKDKKGRLKTYPLKGKYFAGRHNKGFYDSIAIFGVEGSEKKIALNEDYTSLLPRLIRPPKTADEILELIICDPRYLNYIDIKDLKPILMVDPDFLKHIKIIVRDSTERILSNNIENLTQIESKSLIKLKKRYKKEIEFYYHELTREIKHTNLDVSV